MKFFQFKFWRNKIWCISNECNSYNVTIDRKPIKGNLKLFQRQVEWHLKNFYQTIDVSQCLETCFWRRMSMRCGHHQQKLADGQRPFAQTVSFHWSFANPYIATQCRTTRRFSATRPLNLDNEKRTGITGTKGTAVCMSRMRIKICNAIWFYSTRTLLQ